MEEIRLNIDNRKCSKQTTVALIINGNNVYVGSNWCQNPQKECPRGDMPTGTGYELCKTECQQLYHAEVDACRKAGRDAQGSTMVLFGHYYCCDSCKAVMEEYGISRIIVFDNKGKFTIGD